MEFRNYIRNGFRQHLTVFLSQFSDDSKIYSKRFSYDCNCFLIRHFSIYHLNFVTNESRLIFSADDTRHRNFLSDLSHYPVKIKSYKISDDSLAKSELKCANNLEYQYFVISLYFIVLIDQFCFTYLPSGLYPIFRMLTNFPKFMNRYGLNIVHDDPAKILNLLNTSLNKINTLEIVEECKTEFFQILDNLKLNYGNLTKYYGSDILPLEAIEDISGIDDIKTKDLWKKFRSRFMNYL